MCWLSLSLSLVASDFQTISLHVCLLLDRVNSFAAFAVVICSFAFYSSLTIVFFSIAFTFISFYKTNCRHYHQTTLILNRHPLILCGNRQMASALLFAKEEVPLKSQTPTPASGFAAALTGTGKTDTNSNKNDSGSAAAGIAGTGTSLLSNLLANKTATAAVAAPATVTTVSATATAAAPPPPPSSAITTTTTAVVFKPITMSSLASFHMNEILGHFLYQSSFQAATGSDSRQMLDSVDIKAIVNVTADLMNTHGPRYSYYQISVYDDDSEDLSAYFTDVTDWIESHRLAGRRVLVHCHAGISRSSTVVLAYLMRYHKYRLADAFKLLVEARPCAQPNPGFWRQLERYERQLIQATAATTASPTASRD